MEGKGTYCLIWLQSCLHPEAPCWKFIPSFPFSLSLFHTLPSSPEPPWVHSQSDSLRALAKKVSRIPSLTSSWRQTHRTGCSPLSEHPNWSLRCTLIGSVWVTCSPLNQSPGWRDGMLWLAPLGAGRTTPSLTAPSKLLGEGWVTGSSQREGRQSDKKAATSYCSYQLHSTCDGKETQVSRQRGKVSKVQQLRGNLRTS